MLVKRHVAKPGGDLVRTEMQATEGWYICRIGFVETVRAVVLAAGHGATQAVRQEWPSFGFAEGDQQRVEHAARLTRDDDLRSLDALQLAAALLLSSDETVFATWDRRLHAAAPSHQLRVLPASLP